MNLHREEHLKLPKTATIPITVLTSQAKAPIKLMRKATCYFPRDILMAERLKKLIGPTSSFLYFLLYPATGGLADTLINKRNG